MFAAGVLLLLASPLLLAAMAIVLIFDGRPIFYRGRRLGLHAKPFSIYKIRSLRTDAESQLGGQLLSDTDSHKTRTGSFLRETRLDELPQLFLVLTGKMALFGPRPERPEVYAEKCRDIPGYTDRFLVRPGVFGYSQILTPHGAPKRVRALIDRRFVHFKRPVKFDFALLGLTLLSLVRETTHRIARFTRNLWRQKVLGRYQEKRSLRRVRPAHSPQILFAQLPKGSSAPRLLDLTAESFLAIGPEADQIQVGDKLTLLIGEHDSPILHRAGVRVKARQVRPALGSMGEPEVVVQYEPWSENSNYFIEQYLLEKSIVKLPRRMRRAALSAQSPE